MQTFAAIVRWEVMYYLRRVSTYVYFLVFVGIAGLFMLALTGAFGDVALAGVGGKVKANAPLTIAQIAPPLLSMILLIVAAEVALHVTLSLCGQEEAKDERDVLVAAKAARNAYYLSITGLAMLGGHAAMAEVFAFGRMPGVEVAVLAVVLAVTIAEVGHYASQLYYYRRGV